jgi:hypothetical protein
MKCSGRGIENIPPLRRFNRIERKDEKYNQSANSETSVKSRGSKVVESAPPLEVPGSNNLLEQEPDDAPCWFLH